jgi:hypothetical protein
MKTIWMIALTAAVCVLTLAKEPEAKTYGISIDLNASIPYIGVFKSMGGAQVVALLERLQNSMHFKVVQEGLGYGFPYLEVDATYSKVLCEWLTKNGLVWQHFKCSGGPSDTSCPDSCI